MAHTFDSIPVGTWYTLELFPRYRYRKVAKIGAEIYRVHTILGMEFVARQHRGMLLEELPDEEVSLCAPPP